jgi:hypothetical protein
MDSSQRALLCNIQTRIEDANEGINAGNTLLGKVSDALRMDWLRQLGSELKSLLYRSIAVNIATYQAVVNSQAALPSRLERSLIDEPFILEDALGRVAPVHLQFVTSWEAFNAVLEIRFRGLQGHQKIIRQQYGLQDRATGRELEQSRNWERALLPGQRVEMSIVFHSEELPVAASGGVTCPGCHTPDGNSTGADIQCKSCLIWYRRITVVEESSALDIQSNRHADETHMTSRTVSRKSNGKRGATEHPEEENPEDVRDFKRVRILSTQEPVNYNDIYDSTGQTNPYGHSFFLATGTWENGHMRYFKVSKRGVNVSRREDNNMINATKLLDIGGIPRLRRDEILKAEKIQHVIKTIVPHLQGVWIPYERALGLANEHKITDLVYPLFVHDINYLLYSPWNKFRTLYMDRPSLLHNILPKSSATIDTIHTPSPETMATKTVNRDRHVPNDDRVAGMPDLGPSGRLIRRIHAANDTTDPWSGITFTMPVDSDALADGLKQAYPMARTLRERKHWAALDFLQAELRHMR